MKIVLTLIILALASTFGFCQSASSDAIVYTFMNDAICKTDTISFNLRQNSEKWHMYRDTTSFLTDSAIFSNEDFDFFRKQLKNIEKFKWNENLLNGAKVISKTNIRRTFKKKRGWQKFRNKYGNCLSSYSMPIFNLNYDYCIIQVGIQCDWLAGRGGTNVYKLIEGRWVFIKSYSMWVS